MPSNPTKKHFTYTIKDFYRKFKKEERDNGKEVKDIIPYKKYRSLVEDFFAEVFKKIIQEQMVFMMPYSLGSIHVKAAKINPKNLAIDFKKTKELGKTVRHLNTHTYQYYFMVKWEKGYVLKNRTCYKFKPTASKYATKNGAGKKALSKHIRKLSEDPETRSFIRI